MSTTASDTPESGQLPGRYEWVVEPARGEVPADPDWNVASDVMRSFEAEAGASLGRQDALGTPDAVDHNRAMEEPSLSLGYDLQRFPVDTNGDPQDPSAYGILRDEYNRLEGTLLWVSRREYPGGNDGAGVREYTVVRGAAVSSVSPTLDPSGENPILMELEHQPFKVRSYKIHQPSSGTTLDIVSDSANDSMDVTIEDEGAAMAETVSLNGTTTVTTTSSFSDIDAIWLADNPEGDIEITDGSGTTLCEIEGGLTYSDDDQPVDGDRGVPALGSGSHATEIGTSFEHFVGDRFERPVGEAIRPRVNSASWTVENDINTSALHDTLAPAIDEGSRTVSVEADVAGEYVSHDSMMESLQKVQHDLEHELSGGVFSFKNTTPTDSASRTAESDQGVASMSETLSASGDPAITMSTN
ncbi:hypothetical protein [Halosimplex sp. J119]